MSEASEFLKALYRNAQGYAEIRLLHKSNDYKLAKKIYRPADSIHTGNFDYLAEMNQEYHIYHRNAISTEQRSRKDDICAVTALWLDIDGNTDEHYQRLEDLNPPPTAIVYSGGGFHGYWFLKTPLIIDSLDTREAIERTMEGMMFAYGNDADPKTKDITRILRTPGFYNIKEKYNPYPLCKIVYLDPSDGDRYHFWNLRNIYEPLGRPAKPVVTRHIPQSAYSDDVSNYAHWYLSNSVSLGNRNKALYTAARCYLDAGKTQFEAEQDLISKALSDGLTQSEITASINSAFRNSPNRQVNNTMHSRYAIGDKKRSIAS